MANNIFEEIKQRYEKSNRYMLCVSYEDIGILIHIIEELTAKLKDKANSIDEIEYKCKKALVNLESIKKYFEERRK